MSKKMNDLGMTLDMLNMFVGVYCEKYHSRDLIDYFKSCYNGIRKRSDSLPESYKLFFEEFPHQLCGIDSKFRNFGEQERHNSVSRYNKEIYRQIAEIVFSLKDDEARVFTEYIYYRESLVRLSLVYQDLTGPQLDFLDKDNHDLKTDFYNSRNRDEKYPYKDCAHQLDPYKDPQYYDQMISFLDKIQGRFSENTLLKIDKYLNDVCHLIQIIEKDVA